MYDEQSRINAMISYFFLGPIFLLARSGSPLAHPYVQSHAKKSSLFLLIAILCGGLYFFIKPILAVNILGFALAPIIGGSILALLISVLIYSSFHAYKGREASSLSFGGSRMTEITHIDSSLMTDAEKVRIIASFIPLLGIWISSVRKHSSIELGRKIGTFSYTTIFLCSFLLDGSTGLSLILTLATIILIVYSAVQLFLNHTLPVFSWYNFIPSYRDIQIHTRAGIVWIGEIFSVLRGKESRKNYREILTLVEVFEIEPSTTITLPLSAQLSGIPIVNLLLTPFLLGPKYRAYQDIILEGVMLSIFFSLIWWHLGFQSPVQSILFISVIHLFSHAKEHPSTRAPFVDIILIFTHLFGKSKTKEGALSYSYPSQKIAEPQDLEATTKV